MSDLEFIILNISIIVITIFNFVVYKFPLGINPLFFFCFGTFLFIGLPYYIDPVMVEYKNIYNFKLVAQLTILGLIGFIIGYFSNNKNIKYRINTNQYEIKYNKIIAIFIIGIIIQSIVYKLMNVSLIDKILYIRSNYGTGNFNIWESFWRFPYVFSFAIINASSLLLVYLYINGASISKVKKLIILLIYLIGLIDNFSTGTRMAVFAYVSFPIICCLYKLRGKIELKTKMLISIYISIISIISIFIIIFLSNYRDSGIDGYSNNLRISNVVTYGLNQIIDFQKAIELFSNKDKLNGKTFIALLVNPIPREFWQNKPVGIGAIMGDVDPISRSGTSISITIFGESYVNFGVIGVFFVLFILGILCKSLYYYYLAQPNITRNVMYYYILSFIPNEVRGGFLEVSMRYIPEIFFMFIIFKLCIVKKDEIKKHYNIS